MKANEAPEKIYLATTKGVQNLDTSFVGIAHSDPQDIVEPIEYIRTDAFIEKAVEFMEKIDDVDEYSWYNEEEHASGITEECIEDFKKYMEGKL